MKIKSLSVTRPRQATHLLFACGLLIGLWTMGHAEAQQKKDLIEVPEIKKFKEEKAAAAAAEAAASGNSAKPSSGKPSSAAASSAVPSSAKPVSEKPAATEPAAPQKQAAPKSAPAEEPVAAETGPAASETVKQLRQALSAIGTPSKQATERAPASAAALQAASKRAASTRSNRQAQRARALALARGETPATAHGKDAHGGDVHWTYEGTESGPQAWGKLKPEFNLCASGKRQSPIAIQEGTTLQGPAEPIRFEYMPSTGMVVNNGHTIQVDLEGENSITVRNSTYKLLQFHFHTPSEEMINTKRYAMVAHLVHKNEAGQLAVVAVLLEVGEPNPLIDTVWTYMPLGAGDKVRLPTNALDLNQILPADKRYYQFFGSLTTPPCSEGVLWMVMKQPLRISQTQFKLFSQQFPFNARPVQAVNGRAVREAQ